MNIIYSKTRWGRNCAVHEGSTMFHRHIWYNFLYYSTYNMFSYDIFKNTMGQRLLRFARVGSTMF